jgi:hypothetical protein
VFDQSQLAQIQGWTSLVQAISAVVIGVAVAAISIVSYRETQRWSKRSFHQELSHAWMQIDQVALSSHELSRVAEAVMYPETPPDASLTDIQKKWFSYMMLNPLVITWSGLDDKVFSASDYPSFERELNRCFGIPWHSR